MSGVERVTQGGHRATRAELQPRDLNRPALDLGRGRRLDVAEMQEEGKFPSRNAVYCWLRKWHVPKLPGRGRRVVVERSEFDAALLRTRAQEHRQAQAKVRVVARGRG